MPATKRKTAATPMEAGIQAFQQASRRKKRKTPHRVVGRSLGRRLKKDPLVTLGVLLAAGVAAWQWLGQWVVAVAAAAVVFAVVCEAWQELVVWAWASRRMLAPFVALALMAVPALLAAHSPRAAVFLGLCGLLFTGYAHVNLRLRARQFAHARGFIPGQWIWMAYLATAWTVLAAKAGLTRQVFGVLLIGWLVWAVWFWLRNRSRTGHQLPLERKWYATIAHPDYPHIGPNDKLVGSKLTNVRVVPGGMAATIVLPEGGKGSKIENAFETIASIYGQNTTAVTIDQVSTGAGAANMREMYILPKAVTNKVITWRGPDLDMEKGTSTIGTYIDGERVEYVWTVPDSGPWHDLVSGTIGSGKSRLLDLLLSTSRSAGGLIVDWVGDPQWGQSLPDWQDQVDWFAPGVEECLKMLRAVRSVMYARNRALAQMERLDANGNPLLAANGRPLRGVASFTPTLQMPLLVVTLEEAHAVLAEKEAIAIVQDMAKMSRKCGIKLRLVTQVPTLSQIGNDNVIRSMIASGNVVVFRTGGKSDGEFAFQGALKVDPVSIPRRMPDGSTSAGLGFTLGTQSRQAPMRTDFVPNPYEYATGPIWRLHGGDAKAAGHQYAQRHRDEDGEDEPEVLEGEVVERPAAEPATSARAAAEAVVVRGPGGITCADRVTQIVRAAGGARVSRSSIAGQLLGTWKLQMITKTIKEVCEDPTKPVWSDDDNRDHLYYKEAS